MKDDPMKERMKKIRLSLQCWRFNDYSPWSIDLNITVCIFTNGLIFSFAVISSAVALLVFYQINLEIHPSISQTE